MLGGIAQGGDEVQHLLSKRLLVLLVAFVSVSCEGTRSGSLNTGGRRPPDSMREWVDAADLIVDATVQDVREVGLVTGFAEDDSISTVTPPSGPEVDPAALPAYPLVETIIRVDEVYKDGTGAILPGQTISVARINTGAYVMGTCPPNIIAQEPGFPDIEATGVAGEEMLYALSRDSSSGEWHATEYSDLATLHMTGPVVVSAGCPPAEVSWTSNRTPDTYRTEMIAVIGSP
jgi:hypothetical protein